MFWCIDINVMCLKRIYDDGVLVLPGEIDGTGCFRHAST